MKLAPLPYQIEGARYLAGRPRALLADEMGLGKEQPITAKILTPSGWRLMGEMRVGDKVIGRDGKPHRVTGVFPQGKKRAYRVTFRDGTSTECGIAHLWAVRERSARTRGQPFRTKPLAELIERGLRYPGGDNKWDVPLVAPVEFARRLLPVDPYVLGVLIGDGYCTDKALYFSNPDFDGDIHERVAELLPEGVTLSANRAPACPQYRLCTHRRGNPVREAVRALKLAVKSPEKFIPDTYKLASVEQRVELLRGLMDTDGSAHRNRVVFHSVSKQLASDVADVVRSLGGVAIVRGYERAHEGKPYEYQVNVKLNICPFYAPRKSAQWWPAERNKLAKFIQSVEPLDEVEQQCIRVDAPDSLYITDDYIVTHNTPQAIFACDMIGAETITVICPGVARGGWAEEFERFSSVQRPVTVIWSTKDVVPATGVVIAPYHLARHSVIGPALEKRNGDVLILDEAHYCKDPTSQQTKAILGYRASMKNCIAASHTYTWALSGTPAPNNPGEFFSLFRLQEYHVTSKRAFEDTFCTVEENFMGHRKIVGARNSDQLRELLKRYMLRRTEAEVGAQRPPLLISPIAVEGVRSPELERSEPASAEAILRAAETGDWSLVSVPHIATTLRLIGVAKAPAAANLAIETLNALPPGEKVLIFARHREVMRILQEQLAAFNPVSFIGGMTPQEKDDARVRFQTDLTVHIAIAQITVAKEALTLTAATRVFILEPSWVPDDNRQAIKRAHRHGQTRPVFAYFVSLVNSVDQRVMRVLAHKSQMQREFLD